MRMLVLIGCLLLSSTSVHAAEATFYHSWFENRTMSNGSKYKANNLTAAHMTLPLGSWVQVTNVRNGRKVRVKITDRGGFNPRNIDLSYAAFGRLDRHYRGRIKVKIKRIK